MLMIYTQFVEHNKKYLYLQGNLLELNNLSLKKFQIFVGGFLCMEPGIWEKQYDELNNKFPELTHNWYLEIFKKSMY